MGGNFCNRFSQFIWQDLDIVPSKLETNCLCDCLFGGKPACHFLSRSTVLTLSRSQNPLHKSGIFHRPFDSVNLDDINSQAYYHFILASDPISKAQSSNGVKLNPFYLDHWILEATRRDRAVEFRHWDWLDECYPPT